MPFRSSPKAWTSANCEVSWRSRISKLQMQKPEVPLFSSGVNGLGHWETPGNTGKFQVSKPHQVPFIHVPCVSMLFWDRCLVLQVCLGHVGSMAFPWLSLTTNLQIVWSKGYLPATQCQCIFSFRLVPILGMISSSPHTSWYFIMFSSQHPSISTRWELPLRFADQDGRWCGNQTRMGLLCRGQWLFGGDVVQSRRTAIAPWDYGVPMCFFR